jgi:type IV secretion system protein VirD4
VALPDDFEKDLSTMRSRGVSVSIILQNMAQLRALFEKQWESVVGNCDEFLYLGGNEQGTHEYVSKLLGKSTIDTNTYGRSTGRNGNYSTNFQIAGRELMTPDEVRMLDNRFALLFIRGERPVQDEKFDILRHPFVGATTDGHGKPYVHGTDKYSTAVIQLIGSREQEKPADAPKPQNAEKPQSTYALYTEEDLEEAFEAEKKQKEEENNQHENTQKQTVLQITRLRKKPKPSDGAEANPIYPKPRWQARV